jgi:AraC-like DNA-binding protein
MPGSSTSSFADCEDYRAELSDVFAGLVVTTPDVFSARATRIALRRLSLLRARESLSRVAFVSLPSDRAFISFSSDPALSIVWRGLTLEHGEIMFHGCGERLHQRTVGHSCWGMIELSTASLAAYAKIESGAALAPPAAGRVLRPSPKDRKRLVRIHREAARLAETRPEILGHPEVIRGMEAELGEVLAVCLTNAETRPETEAERQANEIMVRFEQVLTAYPDRNLHVAEVCDELGVSGRALHKLCLASLGVSAPKYMQLRRLGLARAAIMRAEGQKAGIAEIARQTGFPQPGRFSAHYRAAFGETPSKTLERARKV